MRVFILGGTGVIGTAVLRELIARSHTVVALSRSETASGRLLSRGATVCRGDLREPATWIHEALACDAVIHVAATFDEDMGDVDSAAVSALIRAAASTTRRHRFLYTGGCWLYGETEDDTATESRPFQPLPAFEWMVRQGNTLLNCQDLSTAIIHPAMVYHPDGGVFERFLTAAREDLPIEIWGDPQTRWPIIERSDLACAYCDLLVRPDLLGHFNAVSEEGVCVGDVARTFAKIYGNTHKPVVLSVDELVRKHGAWAKGPTLDQQMSSQKLRDAVGWYPKCRDYRSSGLFAH